MQLPFFPKAPFKKKLTNVMDLNYELGQLQTERSFWHPN